MQTSGKIKGVLVPMITPFTENGQIDEGAVEKIVYNFIKNQCKPFLLGTTGEYASMSLAARQQLVKQVCKIAGTTPEVFAGIASNCLTESIEVAKIYFDLGVRAVVAHVPNYYPLDDAGMLKYFEQLVENISGDLIIYNIPVTTHHSIPVKVIEQLSHHERIVALKDSERNKERLEHLVTLFRGREDFSYLVGWGNQMTYALRLGADGIVPGTGNIVPALYRDIMEAAAISDWEKAEKLQALADEISLIYQKYKILSRVFPALKVILNELDLCSPHVLPPLLRPKAEDEMQIRKQIREIRQQWSHYFE